MSEESVKVLLPESITRYFDNRVYENYHCANAWKYISIAQFEQILETVRNRLLHFVLELEEGFPEQDPPTIMSVPESATHITNVFNTTILGNKGKFFNAPQASGPISTREQKGAVNISKKDVYLQSDIAGDASIAPAQKKSAWVRLFDWIKALAN